MCIVWSRVGLNNTPHVKPSQCGFDMSEHERRHPSDSVFFFMCRELNAGHSSESISDKAVASFSWIS